MKISAPFLGRFSASLLACLLVSSCNPEEYFALNTMIGGADAYCASAMDQPTCEELPNCQPAFEDLETELEEPIFASCVANPPVDEGDNPDPGDGPVVEDDPTADLPTIDDTVASKCANLEERFFYIKTTVEDRNGKKKSLTTKRVKVCHQTGNLSAHTIIIACPALKAHVKHHDDYLGACFEE